MSSSNIAPLASPRTEEEQLVALFAAANMATQASDERIAEEGNKTTAKFCEMMEAIQASMKSTAEEIHSLRERLEASEQRNKELEAARQAEKKASDDRQQAAIERITSLNETVSKLSKKLDHLENNFAAHYHNIATRRIVTSRYPDGNPLTYGDQLYTTGPEGITKYSDNGGICKHQ